MNDTVENILFPTDFSEVANNALLVAIDIAKRNQSILHLLHVVVPKYNNNSFERTLDIWQELEKRNKRGLEKLSSALENQYKITIKTHTAISHINAAESIERLADELSAKLIIMGTHGWSGTRELFMGSNTYTVIKNAACPVLAIPLTSKKLTFQNILLPVRDIAEIEDKFKAITQFSEAKGTRVEFLGVASFNDFSSFECMTKKINEFVGFFKNQELEFVHRNEFCEDIANFVLEYADTNDTELLIINPMIDEDWRNYSLGTHAQKILNHTKKPVLCIKPVDIP